MRHMRLGVCIILVGFIFACGQETPQQTNVERPGEVGSPAGVTAGGKKNGQPQGPMLDPEADNEALRLLQIAYEVPDNASAASAMKRLLSMEHSRLVSTLAYALGDGKHNRAALRFLLTARHVKERNLLDERLTPFLATCIEDADGEILVMAADVAKEMPSPDLIPVLIGDSLEDGYVNVRRSNEGGRVMLYYSSAFVSVSGALHAASGGKIGLSRVRKDQPPAAEKERRELIEKWRNWWAENKPKEDGTSAEVAESGQDGTATPSPEENE